MMKRPLTFFILWLGAIALSPPPPPGQATANAMRAGLARAVITPQTPMWMAGYAARTKPSEGKIHDLYAKAIAIEDARGARLVLVTTDLLGLPGALTAEIAEHANKSYGLRREQILFNSSHTHTGPVLSGSLSGAYDLDAAQIKLAQDYTARLKHDLTKLIGEAIKDLAPATFAFGRGTAPFAMNRRQWKDGQIINGLNPDGVVDRDVPVLRVATPNGALRGVVFGYACHNTTLTGQIYDFSGDYAGFAQLAIEKTRPGVTALFVTGCGADVNPQPRGTAELGAKHGQSLATAVEQVLQGAMKPLTGPLRSAFGVVTIPFATPPTRDELQSRLSDTNIHKRRHAQRMLDRYARDGKLRSEYPYTIQAVRIGDLTLIALAGEVVTDYALRLKRELGGDPWVAGYSNDLCSYIPSARMLSEGGYEAVESQIYYEMPGPYAPALEEKIIGKTLDLVRRVRK
jgi:hypothetical protein